jgi:hypothetical protein
MNKVQTIKYILKEYCTLRKNLHLNFVTGPGLITSTVIGCNVLVIGANNKDFFSIAKPCASFFYLICESLHFFAGLLRFDCVRFPDNLLHLELMENKLLE